MFSNVVMSGNGIIAYNKQIKEIRQLKDSIKLSLDQLDMPVASEQLAKLRSLVYRIKKDYPLQDIWEAVNDKTASIAK